MALPVTKPYKQPGGTNVPPVTGVGLTDTSRQTGAAPGMNAPASPLANAMVPRGGAIEPRMTQGGGSGGSSIGGVSAVNPKAGAMDYGSLDPFIDSAYNTAMTRLEPQMEQQRDRFDQAMINRGIPVGGDAYNEALQQMDANQNDARQSAMFNAMGFGTDIQSQMFGQDATRSQLANALLQSKWGTDLGYAGLDEQGRQFDAGLGEGQRQYDYNLLEKQRQFDDMSSRGWDAQTFGQMMGLEGVDFRNRQYNDYRSDYGDSLLMAMLGYGGGQQPQWNADPNQAYSSQLGYGSSNYGNWANMWGNILGGMSF